MYYKYLKETDSGWGFIKENLAADSFKVSDNYRSLFFYFLFGRWYASSLYFFNLLKSKIHEVEPTYKTYKPIFS